MEEEHRGKTLQDLRQSMNGSCGDIPSGSRPCPFCHSVIPWESETPYCMPDSVPGRECALPRETRGQQPAGELPGPCSSPSGTLRVHGGGVPSLHPRSRSVRSSSSPLPSWSWCSSSHSSSGDWRASGSDRTSHVASVSYTHLRAHETRHDLVCRLLLEKK